MAPRTATITRSVDEQGRVLIPKDVRDHLGIDAGTDMVELEVRVDE